MKSFFREKKWMVFLAVSFGILIILNIVITSPVRENFLQFWDQYNPFEKSTADIFITGRKVNITFNISTKDKVSARQFLNKLGASDNIYQGISIELDQPTIDNLAKVLPTHLTVIFLNDKLEFSSSLGTVLKSSLIKNQYEFATGSAKLSFRVNSDQDYYLSILDLKPLIDYATSSGQIYISEKITPLFPITSKIAKIEIRVNGKNISGEILLK